MGALADMVEAHDHLQRTPADENTSDFSKALIAVFDRRIRDAKNNAWTDEYLDRKYSYTVNLARGYLKAVGAR